MKSLPRRLALFAAAAAVIGASLLGGCTQRAMVAYPPYLPPEYYTCIEAKPSDLVIKYFSTYGNMANSEHEYNGRYFVFKDQLLQDWTIKELDQGWIWIEGNVKCELVKPGDMKAFKIGDRFDVVGLNNGVMSYTTAGLLFTQCYVLTAGTVALPASGGQAFVPGY